MPAKFIVLGSTDEVNACDCCGKSNLKATWAVQMIDGDGTTLYYGSTCVTRNTGKAMKEIKSEAAAAYKAKVDAARAEFRANPARLAHVAKMEEGTRLGLPPGKQFRDFHREEGIASDAARAVIAQKHGLKIFEVQY